jgi:hypothetical protein
MKPTAQSSCTRHWPRRWCPSSCTPDDLNIFVKDWAK